MKRIPFFILFSNLEGLFTSFFLFNGGKNIQQLFYLLNIREKNKYEFDQTWYINKCNVLMFYYTKYSKYVHIQFSRL